LFRFQKSREGRDERGRGIQNEAVKFMYQVLYIGNIVLIVLHLLDVISSDLLADLLLYFIIALSLVGALVTCLKRK
jgi:hypothetical protein